MIVGYCGGYVDEWDVYGGIWEVFGSILNHVFKLMLESCGSICSVVYSNAQYYNFRGILWVGGWAEKVFKMVESCAREGVEFNGSHLGLEIRGLTEVAVSQDHRV